MLVKHVVLARLEHEVNALKGHLECPDILAFQNGTDGLHHALVNHDSDLLRCGLRSSVRKAPHCLFVKVKLILTHNSNDLVDDANIDAGLDLLSVASGHVGDGPANLFLDSFLWMVEKLRECLKHTAVDSLLGVLISGSEDVA